MDAVQAEKDTAKRRYRRVQTLWRLLRCVEAIAALLVVSWSSSRLPAAAQIAGDFLRRLAGTVQSPCFVFLLGNAIVLLLFAKSGNLSGDVSSYFATATTGGVASGDLYEEFLERTGRVPYVLPPGKEKEEVVYEDKPMCVDSTTRACRRSRSERMERRRRRSPELRRAESEVGPKTGKSPPPPPEEESDPEEFRRMIEEFIAKQSMFHREESMAIVAAAEGTEPLTSSAGSPELGILA